VVLDMVYYVYVIQLDKLVLKSRKFQINNPNINPNLPCYYVGQSFHKPETRFWQHKKGYKSNRYVKEYGLGLCPRFYESLNPIKTRKEAEFIEVKLTENLRSKGHGVWSN
jgi:hypothetical protein